MQNYRIYFYLIIMRDKLYYTKVHVILFLKNNNMLYGFREKTCIEFGAVLDNT